MAKDVVLETGVDVSGVATGMAHLRKTVKDSESEIRGSFATMFAAGTVIAAAHGIFEYGSRVAELKEKLGVSAEALQRFGNAAELTGSSLEAVAGAFTKLEINRSKALGGSEQMTAAFEALGVSLDDLQKLSPDQIMEKISHSSLEAADLVKVLGRSAIALRPALEGIRDGSLHAGAGIQEGLIDKIHTVDITLKAFDQSSRAWLARQIVTAIKGADYLGTEVEAIFANLAQGVDLAKAAIGGLFKGDLTSFRAKSDASIAQSAGDALREAFHKRYDDSDNAAAPKSRDSTGGALDTDEQTLQELRALKELNAGGGGGPAAAGSGAVSASQERIAKIQRERYLANLSDEKKLEVIARERGALQNYLNEGKKTGAITDEKASETQLAIYDRDVEIHKIKTAITTRAQEAADNQKEEAAAAAEEADHQQDLLDAAHETTLEMQQTAAGHAAIAEQMKVEWDYQQKIDAARDDGNEALAKELETQRKISLEELKQQQAAEAKAKAAEAAEAAAKAARAKEAARVSAFTQGMQDLADGDWSMAQVDPTIAALRTARGATFGSKGPTGGPNFTEQLLIQARQRAVLEQNARTLAYGMPQITIDRNGPWGSKVDKMVDLQAKILRQLEDTHQKVSEPLG